ncbi:MAG: heavy-metal-associated domain-containing protein [Gammaproteobacteria bacterium]
MPKVENKACLPTYRIKISNMTGENCADLAEKILRDLPGAKSVSVNFKKQVAIVHGYISTRALIETVKEAGFAGELLRHFLNNSHIYYYYY